MESKPERTCDIVMKGGITSGIVYPKAIYEIAKSYRFVNIGGTSAGAIASALTAAAEYNRRENNTFDGFQKLNTLPNELGESVGNRSKLLSLFQPNKSTKKIFNTLINFVEQKSKFSKYIFFFSSLIKNFSLIPLISLLVGALLVYLSLLNYPLNASSWIIIIITLVLLLIVSVISTCVRFVFVSKRILSENYYGLTTGFNGNLNTSNDNQNTLTNWLADLIDDVAGISDPNQPLTFGNLKGKPGEDIISLRMYTTNLAWGKPHSLPFETSDSINNFYFRKEELRKFFPDRIIQTMECDPKQSDNNLKGYLKFPDPEFLPVVVAARMSLSFPILISAIPLYAIDYRRTENQNDPPGEQIIFDKCLFSDGGICSNFPVHLFDSPLPKRPTFAFNLNQFPIGKRNESDQCLNIYSTKTNSSGILPDWYRYENSIVDFLKSIMNTMQNWSDNTQSRMPGYRDRIVHIHLSKEEGGLNLNMPSDIIDNLSLRGKCAGEEFVRRFSGGNDIEMNWNNHRLIRLRTTLGLLEEELKEMENSFKISLPGIEMSYMDLLNKNANDPPASYKLSSKEKIYSLEFVTKLRKFIDDTQNQNESLMKVIPKPEPILQKKPKF